MKKISRLICCIFIVVFLFSLSLCVGCYFDNPLEACFVEGYDATCTTDGRKDLWVIVSDEEDIENIDLSERELFADEKCTEKIEYSDLVIPATGHISSNPVFENMVGVTCTESGIGERVIYCANCHEELSREKVNIDALGHDYGEWILEVSARCDANGVKAHYSCLRCQKNFDENKKEINDLSIPTLEHISTNEIKVSHEPTCTESGNGEKITYCANCHEELSREKVNIDALGHDYGEWISEIPAKCDVTGTKAHYLCSRCQKTFDKNKNETNDLSISVLGHIYSNEYKVSCDPTCTEQGLKCRYCLRNDCSAVIDEVAIPSLGHDYSGDWVLEKDPTTKGTGLLVKTCKNDSNHRETFTMPVLSNSDYSVLVVREATCKNDGEEIYSYIKDSKEFSFTVTVEKKAHSSSIINGYPATCTSDGLTDKTICAYCEKIIVDSVIIPALGHKYIGLHCDRCNAIDVACIAIGSELDLRNIESNMLGKYYLSKDISLSDGWTPIGASKLTKFYGYFDGNGHTIHNVNANNTRYGGLFYENSGTICNIILHNIGYTSYYHEDLTNSLPTYGETYATFGGIAVTNSGIIKDCSVIGSITFNTHNYIGIYLTWLNDVRNLNYYNTYILGGIVGINKGTISNCNINSSIDYTTYNYLGMGLGWLAGVSDTDATYLSSVNYIGGIAGSNQDAIVNCSMTKNFNIYSNQAVSSWKSGQGRRTNLTYNCWVGCITGMNKGSLNACKSGTCSVTREHINDPGGFTNLSSLTANIYTS